MRPEARYAASIGLLDAIFGGAPVERTLTGWARRSRFAGSRDRVAIRDIVFNAIRRKRSLGWIGGAETGCGVIIGMLINADIDPTTVFTGEGYSPAPLDPHQISVMGRSLSDAPIPVAYDFPDFLQPALSKSLGSDFEAVMEVLQQRAPVDLRVNALKADAAMAGKALLEDGIEFIPLEVLASALRVTEGARKLANSRAYRDGLVELQDVSSQMVAEFAAAKPGMTVLDYCAGGGGKTLAMAATMAGHGRLIAHDINPARMKDIPERAARSNAPIEIVDYPSMPELVGNCDLVLVDAPCSGTGAWRRNPAEKWRLTEERLREFNIKQRSALTSAIPYLKPGGRMVYATCSILECENQDVVTDILKLHPDLRSGTNHFIKPGMPGDGFFYTGIEIS